jgi:hypothetical protein
MAEQPVCTCITRVVPSLNGLTGRAYLVKRITVLDPYCHILSHKLKGSTDFEPTYEMKD